MPRTARLALALLCAAALGACQGSSASDDVDAAASEPATEAPADAGAALDADAVLDVPCVDELFLGQGQGSLHQTVTCVDGDLTIATTEAVLLPRLRMVSGSVRIEASPVELTLPALTIVAGDVSVTGNESLRALSLDALERVDGALHIDAAQLSSLRLPALRQAQEVWLERLSPSLLALTLPLLAYTERLEIANLPELPNGLRALNFPRLATAGEVRLGGHDLESIKLPVLAECEALVVDADELGLLSVPLLRWVTREVSVRSAVPLRLAFPRLEEAGSVLLSGGSEVELDELRRVTYELSIRSMPGVAELRFPALVSARSVDISELSGLTRVVFPLLATAQSVYIFKLPALTELRFDALASLDTCEFNELDALARLSLPRLESLRLASVYVCEQLVEVSLPALTTLTAAQLYSLPVLRKLELGALARAESLNFDAISTASHELTLSAPQLAWLSELVVTYTGLRTLSMPALAELGGGFIERNPDLTALDFPALWRVNQVSVAINPLLSRCLVEAINARLTSGAFVMDKLAACPPEEVP